MAGACQCPEQPCKILEVRITTSSSQTNISCVFARHAAVERDGNSACRGQYRSRLIPNVAPSYYFQLVGYYQAVPIQECAGLEWNDCGYSSEGPRLAINRLTHDIRHISWVILQLPASTRETYTFIEARVFLTG